MGASGRFADAYLAEVINEPDTQRRAAAISRLIHPEICHVTFDRAVYGRDAFTARVDAMVASLAPGMQAALRGESQTDASTIFFRWEITTPGAPAVATGAAFVVLADELARWIYAPMSATDPRSTSAW